MKRRHQWRALAPQRQIFATKISDDRNAREGSDDVGIANLQGKGRREFGAVANGLPVTADGANIPRGESGLSEQGLHSLRHSLADEHVGLTKSVDFIFTGPAQTEHGFA